jgi:hypothetical protein
MVQTHPELLKGSPGRGEEGDLAFEERGLQHDDRCYHSDFIFWILSLHPGSFLFLVD